MNLLQRLQRALEQHCVDMMAMIALAAFPFVYYWQATLRLAVFFFGDVLLFFYPTHLAYADALRHGQLPLWEPGMLLGFPLFAEGQIGALYPTHPFLYGLLPIDAATNYDILINLAWIALGTYAFLRALKLHPASAMLGGATFAFGGFFMPRLQHMSVLATASWLPWLLWAFEKHQQEQNSKRRWRWFIVLTLFSGIQLLGGHPQFALMSVVLLSLYALVNWQRADGSLSHRWLMSLRRAVARLHRTSSGVQVLREGAERRRSNLQSYLEKIFGYIDPARVVVVVVAVALGAMLAAVQLLPTYELSTVSNRAAGLLPKFFNAFSLRLPHYLMLVNPFLLGNPYPRVSVEVIGYIGLVPLTLGVGALFVRRNRRVLFFVLIALVALFLGLGDLNPAYRALRYLPLFNYFRVPSRFFFWYTFASATLAAITFDYLLAHAHASVALTRGQKIALAVITLLLAVIIGLVPALPIDFWLGVWVWLPIVLAAIVAWIILGARRGLFTRTTLSALVIGVSVIDLALFASVYTKTYNLMVPLDDFYQPPSSLAVMKDLSPTERVLTSLWIYPAQITMRESLYPNVGMTFGVDSAGGYTPLVPQRVSDLLDLENSHEHLTAPLFRLMNVRYYLVPQMLPVDAKTEGEDLLNPFMVNAVNQLVAIPATPAMKFKVVSSLAQSVNLRDGAVVAEIALATQDGSRLILPLRAGNDTAEWAYERTDVRKVIQHSLPPLATTFAARSAFPTESHPGHNYLAQFDIAQNGRPITITGVEITPKIPAGLLHIEKMSLVLPDDQEISISHLVGVTDQELVYRTNEVAVFKNDDALPRAFLVHTTHLADDATALSEMRRDDFQPQANLVLSDGVAMNNGGAQRANESVQIVEYQPQRVVLDVQANADGYLLLTDAWYPGWVARVDGIETPVNRADYVFRAVRIAPGTHKIEFEYRPMALYVGAGLGVLALTILAGVFVWSRRSD